MKPDASASEISRVVEVIETLGFRGHAMPGENRTAIGITGNRGAVDPAHFENLPGVADAIRVTKPYKLISKELRPEKSVIKVGNATIGGARAGYHRRTVRRRDRRSGVCRCRSRREKRGKVLPRRCFQTKNVALCISRQGRGRAEDLG